MDPKFIEKVMLQAAFMLMAQGFQATPSMLAVLLVSITSPPVLVGAKPKPCRTQGISVYADATLLRQKLSAKTAMEMNPRCETMFLFVTTSTLERASLLVAT